MASLGLYYQVFLVADASRSGLVAWKLLLFGDHARDFLYLAQQTCLSTFSLKEGLSWFLGFFVQREC